MRGPAELHGTPQMAGHENTPRSSLAPFDAGNRGKQLAESSWTAAEGAAVTSTETRMSLFFSRVNEHAIAIDRWAHRVLSK